MATVRVRALDERDLPFRVAWYNSPATYSQVLLDVPFSLAATREWFRSTLMSDQRRDFAFDLVGDDGKAEIVAMGGFVDIDLRHRRAERYFLLDPDRTGAGLGMRLLNWLCNYAFVELGLNRIYGYSLAGNERILRTNEKEGWVLEGTLRESVFYRGRYVDQHVKSMLRSDWSRQPWATEQVDFEVPL